MSSSTSVVARELDPASAAATILESRVGRQCARSPPWPRRRGGRVHRRARETALSGLGCSGTGRVGVAELGLWVRLWPLWRSAWAPRRPWPAAAGSTALALLYLGFAAAAVRLMLARASCGCFGESGDRPRAAPALRSRAGGARGRWRCRRSRPGSSWVLSPAAGADAWWRGSPGRHMRRRHRLHGAARRLGGVERAVSLPERVCLSARRPAGTARLAARRAGAGGCGRLGVGRGPGALPGPPRDRLGGDRPGQCGPGTVHRRLHGILLRDRAWAQHLPERHLRRRLVEVHRLPRLRACAPTELRYYMDCNRMPGQQFPGRLSVRAWRLQPPPRRLQPLPLWPVQHAGRRAPPRSSAGWWSASTRLPSPG